MSNISKLAALQALAAQAAETGPDMNEAQNGGGGGRLLPEGYAFARLVEYIELGKHPQEFQGTKKDAALEVQIGFALYGEGYQNEDGTPYIIRPYQFAVSRHEKAKAFKLFKKLNYKGTAKNFAQLLGEAYLVAIKHEDKSQKDKTQVSRVDFENILPPFDPVTKAPYPIPEARDEDLALFLWDYPSKEAWDALFIEGTWEAKDGKPAQSKNRVQETILSAVNFAGSPLEALLSNAGVSVAPTLPAAPAVPPAAPTVASVGVSAPAVPNVAVAPAMPTAPVMTAPALPTFPSN